MRPAASWVLALAVILAPSAAASGADVRKESREGTVKFTNQGRPAASARRQATPAAALPVRRPPFDELVSRVSHRHGVDPSLVHAIIAVESAYNPRAVSRRGAVGLMQLMPATARELGVRDRADPHQNVNGGVRHLRSLLDLFDGNVDLAVAAYNAGAGAVRRHRGIPPFAETRSYVVKVRRRYAGGGRTAAEESREAPIVRYVDERGTVVFTQFPEETRARR